MMKKLISFACILGFIILLAGCSRGEELHIKLGRLQGAPHGDKSFSDITVVLNGDKIIAVSLDEYQIGAEADYTGVPNSDKTFGDGIGEGKVLFSKRLNSEKYSANMADHGGATQTLVKSYDAIEDFATGKTVAELKSVLDSNTKDTKPADIVSGATLADTYGYLTAIYNAAKAAVEIATYKVDKVDIKLGRLQGAPHGDKSFSDITVVRNGDLILAVSLDEYQIGAAADYTGVPNSDKTFGTGVVEGKVLFSKRVNSEKYSANMADHAGAKQTLVKSYEAIESFAEGKTVSELKTVVDNNTKDTKPTDIVSSSTLADTYGYLKAIYDVANAAN